MIDIVQETNLILDRLNTSTENINKLNSNLNQALMSKNNISLINNTLNNTEQNLLSLRELLYFFDYNTNNKNLKQYFRKSAEVIGIDIQKLNTKYTCYKITLPFLLPNQRKKWAAFKDTIGKSLYYAITTYKENHTIDKISNAAVSFVSYYNNSHKMYIHDNDNQETRDVLNLLNNVFIEDDNSLICDLHYFSKLTQSKSASEVYVCNRSDFSLFYNDFIN